MNTDIFNFVVRIKSLFFFRYLVLLLFFGKFLDMKINVLWILTSFTAAVSFFASDY